MHQRTSNFSTICFIVRITYLGHLQKNLPVWFTIKFCLAFIESINYQTRSNKEYVLILCRAYARIGNTHFAQEQYEEAIKFYQKSLMEHRAPDVLKRCQEVMMDFFHDSLVFTTVINSYHIGSAT